MNYFFIFAVGSIISIILLTKTAKGKAVNKTDTFNSYDLDSISKKMLSNVLPIVQSIYGGWGEIIKVPLSASMAVIRQEGGYHFETLNLSNDKIIGDNGKAVGIMQIHKIAVDDVNQFYGLGFSYDDRYDLKKNITIGILFLNSCYKTSLPNSSKPVWLAFKMYNGGRDETDNSVNPMADTYANKVFDFYEAFSNNNLT